MSKFLFYAASFGDSFNICSLDAENGSLYQIGSVSQPRPAHFALSKNNLFLYVASEMIAVPGGVCAYDISDPAAPKMISRIQPGTQGPCYIILTEDERFLIGCSYFEGNIEVFPVNADGSLSERCFEHRFTATGPARLQGAMGQYCPRAHGAAQIRGTDFIVVSDYSGDRVVCFKLGRDGNLTEISELPYVRGEAVRHFALHPTRDDIVYMVTEYSSNLNVIRVDRKTGALTNLGGIHVLPLGRASFSSAIKCSPDGRFVYITNRNNKNIAVLSIEKDCEHPTCAGVLENTGFVRDIEFSPDGRYMLVGDQDANTISLYRVKKGGGIAEKDEGVKILAESPACFIFIKNPII